ncbi:NAD(P)H-dependent oxidoreductase [Streptomyces sp. NPDC006193]|uniref:NAD(P)H-dependent oxidoreductase n=1 Tax=Streptomyces sp. NPDC006193 TaxID=3155717 RepID=UPI0033AEC42C
MAMFLTVSGSTSPDSCAEQVLFTQVVPRLAGDGHETRHLAVRDLPADALLHGGAGRPRLAAAAELLAAANGVVVATPVYKASYAGLLKAFLDVLPRRCLVGKAVLPLATGHMASHGTLLHEALRTALRSLGATAIAPGCFLTERAARSLGAPQYVGAREQLDRVTALLRRTTARLPSQQAAGVRSVA